LWFFFLKYGLLNYLLGLASNHDPSDFCLLSSKDYRCEQPVPGWSWTLDPPVFASRVLGLLVCATTPGNYLIEF
jgi:hypothetical protein